MNDFNNSRLDQMISKATQLPQQAPYRMHTAVPMMLMIALVVGYLTVLPQSQTMAALDTPLDDINDIVVMETLEQA